MTALRGRFSPGMAALAICAGSVLLAGCSGGYSSRYDPADPVEPGYEQLVQDAPQTVPDDAPIPDPVPPDMPGDGDWQCVYSATWNDDWHDDVLCHGPNGAVDRPYLLEGDGFITEDEIKAAAAEYEAYLNGE